MQLLVVRLTEALKGLRSDERGLSAVEYGLVAILLSLLIIAGATAAGTNLGSIFQNIANTLGAN